ncbi:hypothetical protein GMLC_05320 [Geomonas limicola]|uniref:PAS domain-containing protein n=2 Tax=Geomonas limicola TaxID=2740186 RepID=A0A6V8N5R0_9BACT|nr:hypothetical protein GMLC_05320 [Geomonas limicola]
MPLKNLTDNEYLRAVIDAIPSLVFIVDTDLKVLDVNRAARKVLGSESELILKRLCGEVLHCIHELDSHKKCGQTPFCEDCILRIAVTRASESSRMFREKYRMVHRRNNTDYQADYFVTASPFNHNGSTLLIMVLEDVTELLALRCLSTICSNCHKIKNEEGTWEKVHEYLARKENILFSHGICRDCAKQLFPEFAERMEEPG